MPVFICKTLTPQGQVVTSKVEEFSRLACIRKLRRNGLTPISVTQTLSFSADGKKKKEARKNIKPTATYTSRKMRNKSKKAQAGIWDKLNSDIGGKVTSKDIRIFAQNFYLLKKASFNNIHALTTVIGTTENPRLQTILRS